MQSEVAPYLFKFEKLSAARCSQ